MMHLDRYHPVKLIGKNDRVIKILAAYNNIMLLREYDDFGRPMCICPNGKQGIFCVSPDRFWNGWLQLDTDVEFADQDDIRNFVENKK
jgi:hypothetical protein